ETFLNVADADFSGEEQTENPEARAVRQGPEHGFHVVEPLGHIFALTNIARRRYAGNIRSNKYGEVACVKPRFTKPSARNTAKSPRRSANLAVVALWRAAAVTRSRRTWFH